MLWCSLLFLLSTNITHIIQGFFTHNHTIAPVPVEQPRRIFVNESHGSNPLLWRHNGRDGVPNHQPNDCLLNRFYSGADQRKHKGSASQAFVRGIHRRPVNFPHKWPVTWEMVPFDDVRHKNLVMWSQKTIITTNLLYGMQESFWIWSQPMRGRVTL